MCESWEVLCTGAGVRQDVQVGLAEVWGEMMAEDVGTGLG